MILKTWKCHYMCMGKDVGENETLSISNQQKMINSKEVETLAITIVWKSSFHQYIKESCKKAGEKLNELLRIFPYQ